MNKFNVIFILLLAYIFLCFGKVYAAKISTTILNKNSSYQFDDEISLHTILSIKTDDGTNYYLRGVFYKDGASNYCGQTFNGNSWFVGPYSVDNGWKNFFPIAISNNQWEGDTKFKIDTQDSGCLDSGDYKFKIQRFTDSGSSNFDTQNEQIFTFIIPTVTPTPSPTPTQAPLPTPTITKFPTPTKIMVLPTPTSVLLVDNNNALPTAFELSNDVNLSGSTASINAVTVMPKEVLGKNTKKQINNEVSAHSYNWSKLLIIMGAILLSSACGILVYNKYRQENEEDV